MTLFTEGSPCQKCGGSIRYVNEGKCVACVRRRVASWRIANREKAKASGRAWAMENPELMRRYKRTHRLANRQKIIDGQAKYRRDNPEKCRDSGIRWRAENKESVTARANRRRALQLNAPGRGVTHKQWRDVLADSLGLCVYCNERKNLTMDHVDPLAKGGAHDIDNIAAACGSCNSSKGDTTLIVWLAQRAAKRLSIQNIPLELS